jgi:hypothetical protein
MSRRVVRLLLIVAAVAMIAPGASAETRPLQLGLFSPVQIFPEDDSISGIRLNLIYGVNQDVQGLDIGLVNRVRGEGAGLQYGVVNYVEGDYAGLQNGWVSITKGEVTGVQWSGYNSAGTGDVFQAGLVNVADDIGGFQLGFVNVAKNLHGLQIGLVNVIQSKETLPVLPIVNWRF